MHPWESEALGIVGDVQFEDATVVPVRYLERGPKSAWLVGAFYSPEIWSTWGVGLVRGSLNLEADEPVSLPATREFTLSPRIRDPAGRMGWRWRCVQVCPAIVNDEALGFVIRGPDTDDPSYRFSPARRCDVYAPTVLKDRLGLVDGDRIKLVILPASYRRPGWSVGARDF